MAIAFARVSIHSRAKGHSALAASSYRAGIKLFDSRTGQTYDYSNRHDVVFSELILPPDADSQFLDREYLWNTVEAAEHRKDAQVCKDIVLALPKELNREQHIELVRRFVAIHCTAQGLPADIALHDHEDGNPHAHILIPTRRLEKDRFSKYKARDLNPGFAKGLVVEKDFWGEQWREIQNNYFQEYQIALSVDLNHVISERHRGRHQQTEQHYLKKENQLIEEVRQEIARGSVNQFITHLASQCSVFTRRDVEKLLFKTFQNAQDPQEYLRIMERILAHKEIVYLGTNERGQESYTTRQHYRLEAQLHADVEALLQNNRENFITPAYSLAHHYQLSEEQSEALRHIIECPDISVVIGRPGTGKSYLLKPVKEYYETHERIVLGAALSGKVAKALQAETGIPSSTIASLTYQLTQQNIQLTKKHVLIIDEAGMVDVNNMSLLIREVRKAGAKIVLIGDPDQLKPIHKGEIFRGIAGLTGYIELENIQRQNDLGDRQASLDLAKGHIKDALKHYDKKKAITLSTDAPQDLLNDWEKSLQTTAVNDTVLLAFTRKAVRTLNEGARERLQAQKMLGKEQFLVQGFERELAISTGERLLFRENNKILGVRNGDMGTVSHINTTSMHVKLDTGEHINVPREYKAIDYGYALTVHKSQGMTAKQVQVLIDSTYWDRNLSFVAFTRHKERLKIYSNLEHHATQQELVKTLSRRSIRDNVIDWPLDFATRCGFNPDKLVGRLVNQLAGIGHKIKEQFNYIAHYEAHLVKHTGTNSQIEKNKLHVAAKEYAQSFEVNNKDEFKLDKPSQQKIPIELSELQKLLEKRQKLNGYFAEKADKQIAKMSTELFKNKKLLEQLRQTNPSLLKKLSKVNPGKEIEM
ncbi:TPA: Ti-type conjugative transfer relaxase TraA [Legionella pneumophila]|nr:Ti-type conjugative transfer relaxase TraA [Legionella pneumophila]HAT8333230.1 Ti-type conjugative transfer relaxase TraA [Legionella pneumophila]